MAQLHAMMSFHISPRIPIKMIIRSSINSENRVQNHVEPVSSNGIKGNSTLGLYAMNGGKGPNSYAQNSSYQVYIHTYMYLHPPFASSTRFTCHIEV